MYQIKTKEREAIREISAIIQTLKLQTSLDRKELKNAKTSARQARFLINLIIDGWEEERSYA